MSLSLVFLVSIVLFTVVEIIAISDTYEKLHEKNDVLVKNYSLISPEWLWNLSRGRIELSLRSLVEDETVAAARVVDDLGSELAAVGMTEAVNAISSASSDIIFYTDSAKMYIGKVTIWMSNAPVREQIKGRLITDGFLVFGIMFATMIGAIYANRKIVTKPLHHMISAIDASVGEDLPQPIEWTSDDEIGVVIKSFNDLMARRQIAEKEIAEIAAELREVQKLEAVAQLAGGIAHEINTPSQYIGDNLKFIGDEIPRLFTVLDNCLETVNREQGKDEFQAQVDRLNKSVEELDLAYLKEEIPTAVKEAISGNVQVSRIVLAMKEFSHPGTQSKTSTDINHALQNTTIISRNSWKNIAQLKTCFDPTLPSVMCFPGEMNQVYLNLIVNAAHAIEEAGHSASSGELTIETKFENSCAVVQISDNGVGIPDEIKNRIFQPFFTTKEVGKGTGQGLAIARDIIVKKHGGELSVESIMGKGSSFTIKIPVTEEPDNEEATT